MEDYQIICPKCGGIFEINPKDKVEGFTCRCLNCCAEYVYTEESEEE